MKSTPHQVRIRSIGSGGVGVGHLPDGRVVFVPRTAPGDEVTVTVTKEKKRFAWGRLEELQEASPHRRPPPCRLFPRCGGCALQHLAYQEQLRWKGTVVGDALRKIGGLQTEDPPVEASPREFHYRNKMSFTLRRLPGPRVVAGFHEMERPGKILDVRHECLLPVQGLRARWEGLREAWGPGAGLLPHGKELRLTLRAEGEEGTLVVRGGKGDGEPEILLAKVPGLTSVWRETGKDRLRHLAGEETLRLSWLDEEVEVSGDAFLQVNPEAGQALHRFVLSRALGMEAHRVVDGYCGFGSMGRALAREGREVVGIESDPLSVEEARRNAPPGFRVLEGKVEDHLDTLEPMDLVILNPPRGGLATQVPGQIEKSKARWVVYVSCDPATLARDLRALREGYRIAELRSFDLFPQTAHIETVVFLEKTHR